MPSNPSGPSAAMAPAIDPAFEVRWSDWQARCREHDREGPRRLRLGLVAAVVIGAPVAFYFGMMPWASAR
jgi:hypothetical protein